ncbi:YciI family protein [Saccharothrix deserti]|uniref:YciI family protein n=1 Tax=Saccharothrix deserti TaxID=2593674 RepID=UPI00131E085E|nr:YciI family protein [Saccharothrix deserti]
MKYLVLIYSNPESRAIWDGMGNEERATGLEAYAALNEELAASGELVVTEALADPAQTARVTVRDGQALTTDGPFAEAKELLAGFYLVDCETRERAVEIAARVPEAQLGLVEVRPVLSSLDDFLL